MTDPLAAALTVARHFDEDAFACDFGAQTAVNLPNLEVVIPVTLAAPAEGLRERDEATREAFWAEHRCAPAKGLDVERLLDPLRYDGMVSDPWQHGWNAALNAAKRVIAREYADAARSLDAEAMAKAMADHAADVNAEHGYVDHCGDRCLPAIARAYLEATDD